ncbi:MAG: DNA translocase FtsK [Christensenellaceae bacterium]|nr:DNA translocase FtsK [Christensenellaceae bacterium]MDY2851001.1 DNA translocase FtsK [Christensenellaceae bacterium]
MSQKPETSKKNREGLFTAESFGMALVLYSVLSIIFLLLSDVLFGKQWFYTQFFYGVFGYFSFVFFVVFTYLGVSIVLNKSRSSGNGGKAVLIILFLALLGCLLQTVTAGDVSGGFASYVNGCYERGKDGITTCSAGGAAFAVLAYPLLAVFSPVGCYVVYPVLMLIDVYFLFRASVKAAVRKATAKKLKKEDVAGVKAYPDDGFDFNTSPQMQPVKNSLYFGQGTGTFTSPSARQMKSEKDRSLNILYPDRNAYRNNGGMPKNNLNFNQNVRDFNQNGRDNGQNGRASVVNSDTMSGLASRRTGDFAGLTYGKGYDYNSNTSKPFVTDRDEGRNDGQNFGSRATVSELRTDRGSYTTDNGTRGGNNQNNYDSDRRFTSANDRGTTEGTLNNNRGVTLGEAVNGGGFSFLRGRETSGGVNPFEGERGRNFDTDFRMRDGDRESRGEGLFSRGQNTYSEMQKGVENKGNSGTENFRNSRRDLFEQSFDKYDGGKDVRGRVQGENAEPYIGQNGGEFIKPDLETKTPDTPDFSVYDHKDRARNSADIIMRENVTPVQPDFTRTPFTDKWDYSQGKKKAEVTELASDAFPSDFPENTENTTETGRREKSETKGSARDDVRQSAAGESKIPGYMSEEKKTVFSVPDEGRASVVTGQGQQKAPAEEKPSDQLALNEKLEYIGIPEMPINYKYNEPPLDLYKDGLATASDQDNDVEERCGIIESTLESFGIPAKVENVVKGPTLTRYEISIPEGVPVNKVPPRASDLAMRLAVESIRIEAPIPGKSLIGIEMPNSKKEMVRIKDLLLEEDYKKKGNGLSVVLGKDVVGNPVITDLTKTPHLLVAGATGMGKSVFLNTMIMSLVTKYSPADLRLVLVDPKQVEFSIYENMPHLLINQIITEAPLCIAILDWAIEEMEERYKIFRSCFAQKIDEYNAQINPKKQKRMPKIVIVIDELGDLFSISSQVKRDIEDRIKRLTQKARAAGIHLVVATQRPDVTVITGVIKANLPSRVAFKVMTFADSSTILGEGGAEKLLGDGDMIFKTSNSALLRRIQGAYVSKEELVSVLGYIKDNNVGYYDSNAQSFLNEKKASTQNGGYAASASFGDGGVDVNEDAGMYNGVPLRDIRALREVIIKKSASISLLQRSFSMGYSTAGRLIDWMEKQHYISGFEGSKARKVLITMEEFEQLYGGANLD